LLLAGYIAFIFFSNFYNNFKPSIMKKLRLICTYECNRSCKGCCNKQSSFTQDNIPTLAREKFLHEIDNYKQVIITGGEPCLFLPELHTLIGYPYCWVQRDYRLYCQNRLEYRGFSISCSQS